jgi:hypothetical protein
MKRSSYPFLLAAIGAIGLGFCMPDEGSLDRQAFAAQFQDTIRRNGYAVIAETDVSLEEAPVPMTTKWHPRRWRAALAAPKDAQIPDSSTRFTLAGARAAKVECFVRQHDGRAHFIELRASRGESVEATELRLALKKQFPQFPVILQLL